MPSITSANVANAIVKLVAADALPALVGNLVMGNLVNRDYEPTLAQAGDTVNVPIAPQLVANNIAEGGAVQPQNPSLGNAQIVLNTHAEATFQIPDVTKVLAVPDLLKVYMQPAVVGDRGEDRERSSEPVCGFHGERAARHGGNADDRSDDGSGGNRAVPGEGAVERAEVSGGRQQHLFGDAADPAIQRISDRRRGRSAGADRRNDREDQRLLRVPFAVCAEDGHRAGQYAQPGVLQGCDRSGGPPPAAAAAGNGRDCRIRRTGQLRHARDDELSAEHAVAAVHG